jgi:hypothetical protein
MRRPAATAIIILINHHQPKSDLRHLLQFQFPFSHCNTYIEAFNVGPSFTPSPTIATTWLSFFLRH